MYDLLKLFRVGRSHMALLTQPEPDSRASSYDGDAGHGPWDAHHSRHNVRLGAHSGFYEMMAMPGRRGVGPTLSTVHEQAAQVFSSPAKGAPLGRQLSLAEHASASPDHASASPHHASPNHASEEEVGEDARLLGPEFQTSSVPRLTPAGSLSNISLSGKPRGLLSALMRGLSKNSGGGAKQEGAGAEAGADAGAGNGAGTDSAGPIRQRSTGDVGPCLFGAPEVAPLPPTPTLILPPTQPPTALQNGMHKSSSRGSLGGGSGNYTGSSHNLCSSSAFQPYASLAFPETQPLLQARSSGTPPPSCSGGGGGPTGCPPAPSSNSSARLFHKARSRQASNNGPGPNSNGPPFSNGNGPPDGVTIHVGGGDDNGDDHGGGEG